MIVRPALLVLLLAAVTVACRDEDAAPRTDTTAGAPHAASVTATEYAIAAPDSIPAGWTTFRLANRGEEVHYGHIVRLDPGHTVEEMAAAYLEAIRTSGPRPAWVKRFGGPGGTPPGGSSNVTQRLEPGSYVWICPVEDEGGTPHFARGEVQPFVVHAAVDDAASAAEPTADAVIRLVDHAFAIDSPLGAGRRTIRVENAGSEAHDVVVLKLAAGRTIDDVRAWLNPERARRADAAADPPPPLEEIGAPAGGIAAIAPGMHAYYEAELTPGDYVLLCMVTAPDGRSHIEHGMIRQLRID